MGTVRGENGGNRDGRKWRKCDGDRKREGNVRGKWWKYEAKMAGKLRGKGEEGEGERMGNVTGENERKREGEKRVGNTSGQKMVEV